MFAPFSLPQRQRRQFKFWQENKPTSMTPERIEKLNKLGFSWDCRKNTPPTRTSKGSDSSGEESNPRPVFATTQTKTPLVTTTNPRAKNITAVPLTVNDSIKKSTGGLVRPIGGFPLPRPPLPSPTEPTTAAKGHRDRENEGLARSPGPSEASAISAAKPTTPAVPSIENLPCEFFSFSRKFTKFPKINLSK
jgi:hypothetical protein